MEPARSVGSVHLNGTFAKFDQSEFITDAPKTGLDTVGFWYLPAGCVANPASCKTSVVFHGCGQAR